jgi:hypothetical protein
MLHQLTFGGDNQEVQHGFDMVFVTDKEQPWSR